MTTDSTVVEALKPFVRAADRPHPLLDALGPAVPLLIAELAGKTEALRLSAINAWTAAEVVDDLIQRGDVLLFGGKTAGESFAVLARALAALAYQPGGVTAFGTTWCAAHARWGKAAKGPICAGCVS